MKIFHGISIAAGIALIGTIAVGAMQNRSQTAALNMARYATPAAGAPITLTCATGADDDSGALAAEQVYRISCFGSGIYLDFGAAAVTATSGDTYLAENGVFTFTTGGPEAILHVSCLGIDATATCSLTKLN